MSGFGLILNIGSLLVALMALWMISRLRRELADIKRNNYYLEQKVKAVHPQIEAAMAPLRIQTAMLAQGKAVSHRLIQTGRLYQEISAKEAGELFGIEASQESPILWLDVRTNAEFSKQHIPGAKHIPVEDLEMRYDAEVPPTMEKIIVYCAGGDRSRLACDFLSRHEVPNVYYMKDGVQAWTGPVEGNQSGSLIQIASKTKQTIQNTTMSSSIHSS